MNLFNILFYWKGVVNYLHDVFDILLLGGGRVISLRGLCEMTCEMTCEKMVIGEEGENRSTATGCLRHFAFGKR
ncbi:MAG: hypothetical protein IPP51_17745 [Bacteroidetes bacterium]|nr:hypothetical protein [Bacteroidota bacterium]